MRSRRTLRLKTPPRLRDHLRRFLPSLVSTAWCATASTTVARLAYDESERETWAATPASRPMSCQRLHATPPRNASMQQCANAWLDLKSVMTHKKKPNCYIKTSVAWLSFTRSLQTFRRSTTTALLWPVAARQNAGRSKEGVFIRYARSHTSFGAAVILLGTRCGGHLQRPCSRYALLPLHKQRPCSSLRAS